MLSHTNADTTYALDSLTNRMVHVSDVQRGLVKQYRNKLLIYSQSDVYMVSKADLIEQTTSLSEELRERGEESVDAIYDLSGRKVDFPFSTFNSQLKKKGIYIQNGVKRAVK